MVVKANMQDIHISCKANNLHIDNQEFTAPNSDSDKGTQILYCNILLHITY
jgi:hypothetical protein